MLRLQRRISFRAILTLAFGLTCTPNRLAAQAPQDIVVNAAAAKQLHEIVKSMTPVSNGHQIGRWHGQVCTQIIGLDDVHAAIIKSIFENIARDLEIRVRMHASCVPNISIVVAANADEIAADISKKANWLLVDPKEGDPPRRWENALLKPQPVRWFVADRTGPPDGTTGVPSRIRLLSEEYINYSYVLVDAGRLKDITWRQIANYIALVALSGPTPGAAPPPDSILTIFDNRDAGRPGPTALTAWDKNFLHALYDVDPRLHPDAARREIERQIKARMRMVVAAP